MAQEERTRKGDPRHDGVDVVHRLLARFDTRDKAAVALHVVRHHLRIDDDRRIKIGEGDHQHGKRKVVPEARHVGEGAGEAGAILVKSIGMNINACAKMMGITFAAFIFRGMY